MQALFEAIMGFFQFIIEKPYQLWLDFLEWAKHLITVVLPDVFYGLLPPGVAEYLKTFDLGGLADLLTPVYWFIPFWEIMGIYFIAYGFAANIRLVRWLIGFIPTIEG